MKKMMALILLLALVMTLCACNHADSPNSSDDQIAQTPSIDLPNNTKNTPDQKLIQEDLEQALFEHNQYASITGIETVKSLTNEGTYSITLNVTAETKYADWTYEAELTYTKYDQGWMVDDVDWVKENYNQVRIPDSAAMNEYVAEYLPNHQLLQKYSSYGEYMFPIESSTVEFEFCDAVNDSALIFRWYSVYRGKFQTMTCPYTSYWEYDEKIDNWTLIVDDERGSLGYHVHDEDRRLVTIDNLDFTGSWDDHIQLGKQVPVNITISNYSPDGFEASIYWQIYDINEREIVGSKSATGKFTRSYEKLYPYSPSDSCWIFRDEKNNYIIISYGVDSASLNYFIDGAPSGVMVKVKNQLPTLS